MGRRAMVFWEIYFWTSKYFHPRKDLGGMGKCEAPNQCLPLVHRIWWEVIQTHILHYKIP